MIDISGDMYDSGKLQAMPEKTSGKNLQKNPND